MKKSRKSIAGNLTAMSRCLSRISDDTPFVVLGNPENRRVQMFERAFRSLSKGELRVVSWLDFIRDPAALTACLTSECALRIESPGENFEVERAILGLAVDSYSPFCVLDACELAELQFEKGRILPTQQWYRGWRVLMDLLSAVLAGRPGCRVMNPPGDIATMFDKADCHALFEQHGVPTPGLLGLPDGFADVSEMMIEQGCRRVFVKPRHSSSASGVVALEIGPSSEQAFSSVEMVHEGGKVKLFNSLFVRRYDSAREISTLITSICRHPCIAERWFPKAGLDGQRFDLRVLVIAGRARHVVVRQSKGPITNLHLGNRRGNLDRLKERMGPQNWRSAMEVCERAAAVFPGSLYIGVDLLVAPSFRRFAVAEVNAFGDLLPNLEHDGMDTYTAELVALGLGQNRDVAVFLPEGL